MRRRQRHGEEGTILLFTLTVVTSLLILTAAGLTRSMSDLSAANVSVAQQQAFALAEAGVDQAVQWLTTQPLPPPLACTGPVADPCPAFSPFGGPIALGGESYTVEIDPDDNNPTAPIAFYTLKVTATVNGAALVTRTIHYTLQTESFAHFGWFTNVERSRNGWGVVHGGNADVTYGPFHTNSGISILGEAVFKWPVATNAPAIENCFRFMGTPCTPIFEQGVTFGTPPVPLPDPSLTLLKSKALVLPGETRVRLDGSMMYVTNSALGWTNRALPVATNPAIFVEGGRLLLDGGLLDGQLTLATDQNIFVYAHVLYTCDAEEPESDPDCLDGAGQVVNNDDLLGLVASDSIKLATAAPPNLTIQGSLLAVQGALEHEGCETRASCSRQPVKGTFHLFGGMISRLVGWTGDGVHGYRDDDRWYDPRLLRRAPPYFPQTGRYQAVLWKEEP